MRSLIFSPPNELRDLIQSYVDEGNALREQITDICIHMNGGVEFNTAWGMSFEDREVAVKRINKKIKDKAGTDGVEYM